MGFLTARDLGTNIARALKKCQQAKQTWRPDTIVRLFSEKVC